MIRSWLILACVAFSASSRGQTFSVFIEGPADASQRALIEQGARQALKEVSSLAFEAVLTGQTQCVRDACWVSALEKQSSLHVLVVTHVSGLLRAHWVDLLTRQVSQRKQVAQPVPDNEATGLLLRTLIPGYATRGYARIEWAGHPVWGLRVDGTRVSLGEESHRVVPAGQHTVDVELATGEKLLFPLRLNEAESAKLPIQPWAQTVNPSARGRVFRAVSYGLWTTGAVAIGASFVAATLSREASARLTPCEGPDRTCLTVSQAQSIQHVAKARADQANLLLISGATLATAGVGLFVWQWVIP